ncbi:MAG: hypothetical protein RLZZ88_1292 [Actinomycetota bacterium]
MTNLGEVASGGRFRTANPARNRVAEIQRRLAADVLAHALLNQLAPLLQVAVGHAFGV